MLVQQEVKFLFKFIIIGDTSVGKSCVLHQYLKNKCNICRYHSKDIVNSNSKHTVGVEFGQKFLQVNSGGATKTLKL